MDVPDIEKNLPRSFLQLHEAITKILKENDILHNAEESKVDQDELIVKTVMKLLSSLLSHNSNTREEIKSIIRSMKPEIA